MSSKKKPPRRFSNGKSVIGNKEVRAAWAAELTPRQRLFVGSYLESLSATEAARKAGYSRASAGVIGSKLLANPKVAAGIKEAMDRRQRETKVDAIFLLEHLADMLKADLGDIVLDDGSFRPIHEWPKIWRQMMQSCDVEELTSWDDKNQTRTVIGRAVKARFVDRLKAIELIGRHIDVRAFEAPKNNVTYNDHRTQVSATVFAQLSKMTPDELAVHATKLADQLKQLPE